MALPYYNPLMAPTPITMEYRSQNQDISAYQQRTADLESQLVPQRRKDQKYRFKITCCAITSLLYVLLCYLSSTFLNKEEAVLSWIFMLLILYLMLALIVFGDIETVP